MSKKLSAESHGLMFIFVTMLIDVIGFGIIIPVLPTLIQQLIGGDLSTASTWGGFLMFTYSLMQFVFAPIIGALSDNYGRRPVLLASLLAFCADYILLGFAPTIGWLFVGRIIAGITGASFSAASAYIADVSPPEKRAQNFGMIGAAFGLGFIIGPMLGGLLSPFGARVPFFAAALLAMINFLYGFFILPESLKPENRRKFDWSRANPLGILRGLNHYPIILGLMGALFCISIAGHANQSTWTYITMEKFGWNERAVGMSLAWVGLMTGLVQGLLSRKIIPKLGLNRAVFVGLSTYALGFLLFALATEGWMMFAFMVIFAFGGIAMPAIQGVMSNQIPANEQGELQGKMGSLMSITSIIGPILMSQLFFTFTKKEAIVHFAGAPFLMGAVLTILSAFLAWRTLRNVQSR